MQIDWKITAATVAGFAAGAVAALTYAPTDGETLRKNVARASADGVNKAKKAVELSGGAYGATARVAQFQVTRLFAAATAGMEEARRVKQQLVETSKEFEE